MRSLIIFFLAISTFKSMANTHIKKIDRKVAQVESESLSAKTFLKFLSCRIEMEQAKDSSWTSCLDNVTVSNPTRRQSLAQFLFLPYNFKKIRDCQKSEILKMKAFPDFQNEMVCFEFDDSESHKVGAAFFIRSEKNIRLYSLFEIH